MKLAIIGIGCLFPKAGHLGAYWSLLKDGVDAITPIPASHWNPDDYFDADPKKPDLTYAQRGGFLDPHPFAPGDFGIAPNDLEATDTSQLLGMVAAQMALRDAGYGPDRAFDRSRVSVVLGVTGTLELVVPLGARLGHPRWRQAMKDAGVPEAQIDDAVKRIGESYVGWQENSFPGLLGNVVAGRIANRLDLHGTNCVVDAACASSLSAMHLASLELTAGRCDVVVTGGVDTFNDIFMYMCFSKTPALSPTGDARPFSTKSDGTILGEGLGLIVLKRLADAERDSDRIYAVIRGIGTSSDGKGNAIYAPSAEGQKRCLNDAYQQAGVSPTTIELVEAHGTGTKVGDATELKALNEVFQTSGETAAPWCALGSVKSQIGHTKAAAGAAGLIKAALALHHKVLPPTIKVDQPADIIAPGKTPFYVNTTKRPWLPRNEHPRRAGVSAFGFGGSNFHAVLEEHRPQKSAVDWDGRVLIAAFSSDTATGIKSKLESWDKLDWSAIALKSAESRVIFRSDAACRLLMVFAKDGVDPMKVVASARKLLDSPVSESFATSTDGVYFGRGAPAGKLGVLFPGQGSQYVGMLRDLACQFPAMLDVLTEANAAFAEHGQRSDQRLSDFIYPPPAFNAEANAKQEQELRATDVAQPAIGAISLGAMRVLDSFGVRPDAAAGHSYGELTALCAAGCYDQPALHSLSRLRGRLMAEVREGDPGSMLAVHASADEIERTIRDERLDLVIANRNAPKQSVLSGSTREIERASKVLSTRQMRSTRLPVAAAFHSTLIASAEKPFREALEGIRVQASRVPVYSNSSGHAYPVDPAAIRELLAGQLARPVNFVQEIVGMIRAGVRTFLEVGPGGVLTRLVESTVKEHAASDGVDCFALDASNGKRSGILDLANVLARLAARGHAVDLTAWEKDPPHPVPKRASDKPTLTVPICGANYVAPKSKRTPTPAMPEPPKRIIDSVSRPSPSSPPSREPPVSEPSKPPPSSALAQAIQLTQEGLSIFQQMQVQTAQAHQQFLHQQETAQQSLQRLIEQQQQMLLASIGAGPVLPVAPVPLPKSTPTVDRVQIPIKQAEPTSPTPPPMQAPKPKALTSNSRARTQSVLLEVVAEKTGYPAEMLNLDMGLDADLGIDSIKRVEILSSIQERLPDAPLVKPEHLGTLQTLEQIVTFLTGSLDASSSPSTPAALSPPTIANDAERVQRVLLEVVAEKTGYPTEMLNLEMGLDADLGIDSIKRVEILSTIQERLPNAPTVKPEHMGTLNTLNQIATFLAGPAPNHSEVLLDQSAATKSVVTRQVLRSAPLPFENDRPTIELPAGSTVILVAGADALADHVEEHIRAKGLHVERRYWDSAIECPASARGLLLLAPIDPPASFLTTAFQWLRAAGASLKVGTSVFGTMSRIDGNFGLNRIDAERMPFAGGLAGLAKTAAHEWPSVSCKAFDIDPSSIDLESTAVKLVNELFRRGPIEVGLTADERITLELVEQPHARIDPSLLGPADVVVISGGARGVTAEAAFQLARTYRPTLVLLGRSAPPAEEPDWVRTLTDERSIKTAFVAHGNGSATPREVQRQLRDLLAQREIKSNLARIAATGARVEYVSVDVRDGLAVSACVDRIRRQHGDITGLIHGAGVIEDRLIVDKSDEQFDRVFGTKIDGLLSLLTAMSDDSLKVLALFSSSTGRFGRAGQVDYAVANEVLNKLARRESKRRPNCRVAAINWGPWEGGMVTPELAQLFGREGVGLIPLKDGAEFLLSELSNPDRVVEVVAGVWNTPPNKNPDEKTVPLQTVAWEREVSVESMPVLRSHVIAGRLVVPLALQIEWLAHAAMHANPGFKFVGLNEVRVLHGIKLDPNDSTTIRAMIGKPKQNAGQFAVPVELHELSGGRTLRTRGEVLLANSYATELSSIHVPANPAAPTKASELYDRYLFHGPQLHGLVEFDVDAQAGWRAKTRSAPAPSTWLKHPLRSSWLADPLAIDVAFQSMIVWGSQECGEANLPAGFKSYRQFRSAFSPAEIEIAARITSRSGPMNRADIEWIGADGQLIARLIGGEFVGDPQLARAFRKPIASR